jgi:acyl-coenzyme A thioesterase PaaI-like protein
MTTSFRAYKLLTRFPAGHWLFTRIICFKAPYFASIRPRITLMQPGRAEVVMRQRRGVQNHIGTVHAIACCNACEMAMGMLAEATIPDHLRWLPKAMTVQYLKKATGELRAVASLAPNGFAEGEVVVPVDVLNAAGDVVVHADITLHVTTKR